MKTIEFSEEDLLNINKIGKKLFEDKDDPSSATYKRVLKRPNVNWLKICSFVTVPIFVSIFIWVALSHYNISSSISVSIISIFLTLYIFVNLKRAVICAVKIYQHYAPDSLRNKCRFEPSCSDYMLLAIEKYGLVKGLKKGICRLKRCNINNGGYDYP